MKKKSIAIIVVALIALLAVAGGMYYNHTYITIGGVRYLRETEALQVAHASEKDLQKLTDLQGLKKLDLGDSQLTTAQFDALQAALPECGIRWAVPFQGGTVLSDNAKLTVTTLSKDDIAQLRYLPGLAMVDATACTDYDALMTLIEVYPDLDVSYNVTVGGKSWPQDTAAITIDSAAAEEMEALLQYLPQLQSVTLNEITADPDSMLRVQERYPEISFQWQLDVCGVIVNNSAAEIDLSGIAMESTEEVENCLKYLPNLTKVDMCDCGISNEEMEALNNRHDNTLFVWIVNIGPYPVRTDITYYIPVKYQQRVGEEDCKNLRYCTELVALDLGHMPIKTCEFVSYMPHLKYLILADSGLMSIEPLADLKELVFLEIFLTYVTDYSPLLTVTSLEDLNICHTHGDMEPLTKMTWLKRLWWGANTDDQLSNAEHNYLQSCLPNTTVVTDLVNSTGRGWRQGGHYYDMRDYFGMWYMGQD